jgi:hypothetical protein
LEELVKLLWTIAWLTLISQGAAAQQPRLASIEGTVVERDSGAPIGRAFVELRKMQAVPSQTTANGTPGMVLLDGFGLQASAGTQTVARGSTVVPTAPDGTFVIRDVPPGDYRLYATRTNGHAPGEYGQRGATGEGVPFTLTAGQRMTGVSLVMTPTASITGYVTDGNGEPAGYAHVQALRAVYRDGHRSLTAMQLVQADDRGMFRLFWLPPGEYFVCAKPLDLRRSSEMMHIPPPSRFGTYEQQMRPTVTAVNASRLLDDGSVVEGQYVPVYFPGTLDERRATPIKVRAGQTVGGVDINLGDSLVRTRHIRGRVVDGSTGKPIAASLQIVPQSPPAILLIPTAQAGQDGTFDVWGALPGPDYLIATGNGLNGLLTIDGGASDMNGVTLTMWPGLTINGRIRVDGRPLTDKDSDVSGLTVTLRRSPQVNGLPEPSSSRGAVVSVSPDGQRVISVARDSGPGNTSAADGSFALGGVPPGDYLVTVAVKDDAYVESIRLGARDVLGAGLHVDGPVQGELDIVIHTGGGSIEGTAVGVKREPAPNVTVVAVPEGIRRGRTDLFKTAVTDATGRFRLRGLTPGSYEVFAWEEIESGAWQDPDIVRSYTGLGRVVRIAEGTRASVEVTLITGDR